MKIGFKPQTLVKNLATETFSNNGNTLNRIIEIPATATKPERVLDITYKKENLSQLNGMLQITIYLAEMAKKL